MKKEIIKEANMMRRLMGLELIKESVPELEQLEEMEGIEDTDKGDEGDVIGAEWQKDITEDEEGYDAREDEHLAKDGDEDTKTQSLEDRRDEERGENKEEGNAPDGLKPEDKDEKSVNEDSEGEETYNYGEDEGADEHREDEMEDELHHDEKDMAPHDRIAAIERHLDALKKDMAYDEDHEDRDEEGTHFAESNELSESQTRKLRRRINR